MKFQGLDSNNLTLFCPLIKVISSFTNQIYPMPPEDATKIKYQSYFIPSTWKANSMDYDYVTKTNNSYIFPNSLDIPETGGLVISSVGYDNTLATFNYYPYNIFTNSPQGPEAPWKLDFVYSNGDNKVYNYLHQ
jgi:hypothetical protein